jgi:nitroreductase
MELLKAIKERRSTRRFKDQEVTQETIQELLNLAIWAPTASNVQPWGFVVIQDRAKMKEFSAQAKTILLEHMKDQPSLALYRASLENPNFHIFYNAPVLILIYGKRDHAYTPHDCSMAAQNLMLAAWEKGLGTCWIGFAQGLCDSSQFKESYNIPSDFSLVAPIILGYREQESSKPIPRREYPIFNWIK